MHRYYKFSYCLLILFLVCMFMPYFKSYASASYNVPYARPAIGENCGYVDLMRNLGSLDMDNIVTYFWIVKTDSNGDSSTVDVTVNSSSVEFGLSSYSVNRNLLLFYYSGGKLSYLGSTTTSISDTVYGPIQGANAYGNIGNFVWNSSASQIPFAVNYSQDDSAQKLNTILSAIYEMTSTLSDDIEVVSSRLSNIYNKVVDLYNVSDDTYTLLSSLSSYLQSELSLIYSNDLQVKLVLDSINSKLDDLLNQVINPDVSDNIDGFGSKVDDYTVSEDALPSIDVTANRELIDSSLSGLSFDGGHSFNAILRVITYDPLVIQMFIITFSFVLMGYVLFGKR